MPVIRVLDMREAAPRPGGDAICAPRLLEAI